MSKPACPMCEMNDVLEHSGHWECATCGHDWAREAQPDEATAARVVKDAHGSVLVDGDCEISCKMDGIAIGLKACFVKKA